MPLSRGSHIRDWLVYQGRDDFELREDGPDRWLLSQSAEWDDHDPSHVGRSAALQAAAEDFTRSVTRRRPATGRAERDARL